MKKEFTLKKKINFDRIISNNKPLKYKEFIIYYEFTDINDYHFGVSVGKKIGNAVTRNKIKRQVRNIIDKNIYKNGFNCIIIVGRGIKECSFEKMSIDLNVALRKLNIVEEKNNEE